MSSPYDNDEAEHAVQNAINAVAIADEKCSVADYGSEVMGALDQARKALEYAARVMAGLV